MNRTRSNDGVSNTLHLYLREIRDEALLTAAEEHSLAEGIARGDSGARARMIQANLRLVVKIARDYTGRGVVLEDLIGEGNVGLIRAAEEFEPRFGTRFSTYASYWIKQSIRHALITTTTTIRLPAHIVGLLSKWRRAERTLSREHDSTPSFNEVATYLGLSDVQKSLVAKAQQALQLRLESSVAAETRSWAPVDAAGPDLSPDAALQADEERRILTNRLDRLDPRERTIVVLRHGLNGESSLTLKEIGRRLRLTREWVRRIEVRAVRKLIDKPVDDLPADRDGRSSPRSTPRFTRASLSQLGARASTSAPKLERPKALPRPRLLSRMTGPSRTAAPRP
jgi:RNA polymerase primary sigma factor